MLNYVFCCNLCASHYSFCQNVKSLANISVINMNEKLGHYESANTNLVFATDFEILMPILKLTPFCFLSANKY